MLQKPCGSGLTYELFHRDIPAGRKRHEWLPILLMEEIPNNHLACIKLKNNGIFIISTGAGCLPSTVSPTEKDVKGSFHVQQS